VKWISALALAACLAFATAAAARPIVVASKSDTEGAVLGYMILLALEHAGVPTRDRVQLGGTAVVRAALLAGEIDIYPEYTGNAASFFRRQGDAVWKDAAKAYAEARRLDYEANRVVWLAPSPADNSWGVAVRRDVAEPNRLRSFSDFGRWVSAGGRVRLAASAEFVHSASALPAFEATYGFRLRSDQIVSLAGGDTAATLSAAAKGVSGVNAAMVYGTDGGIPFSGLVVLGDDKRVQPVYQPAPTVRQAALDAEPRIADALRPVFSGLDLATLQGLNGRVQVGGEPARTVAESYLRSKGYLR
jgi:osmoprotectant transport system substrate-binding protein